MREIELDIGALPGSRCAHDVAVRRRPIPTCALRFVENFKCGRAFSHGDHLRCSASWLEQTTLGASGSALVRGDARLELDPIEGHEGRELADVGVRIERGAGELLE